MIEQLTLFEYTDEYKENQRIADIKLKEIAEKIKGCGVDVLSLFNGISCGRVALERAGIKVNRYVSYEIDKNANKVAQSNYPNDEYYGDVTTADFTQYKGFDLVIGGSPCTYWSIAKQGRETTPNGEGGRLFMHFARAVKETECKFFLYENNYSIADEIKAFISNELGVDFIMINSALVSAQNRERCYWTNIPGVKQPEDKGILLENILESGVVDRDKSYVLMANYGKTTTREYFGHAQGQMKAIPINTSIDGKARTIKAQYSKTAIANMVTNANYPATAIAKPVNLGHISNTNFQANRVYSVRGKSVCLQSEAGGGGAKAGLYKIDLPDGDYIIRKLTPVECERLQTLPDNYTATVATTNRYKGIGNGWTVDVIAHIFQPLKRYCK